MATAAEVITPIDLTASLPGVAIERLEEYIEDAWADAALIAPCIERDTFARHAALKSILRKAIVYAATPRIQSQGIGPAQVTYTTPPQTSVTFSEAQEAKLRALCAPPLGMAPSGSGMYSVPVSTDGAR